MPIPASAGEEGEGLSSIEAMVSYERCAWYGFEICKHAFDLGIGSCVSRDPSLMLHADTRPAAARSGQAAAKRRALCLDGYTLANRSRLCDMKFDLDVQS